MPFFNRDKAKGFKTYFFEVIVIFTGITASFYFDEWRTDVERSNRELDYLARLDTDLSNDIGNLLGLSEWTGTQVQYCETGLSAMNGDSLADTIFSYVNAVYLFELNDYTIREMQSTGALYTIENDSLKNEILHYYHSADEMLRVYHSVNEKNDDMQDELNNHLKIISEYNHFAEFKVQNPIDGNLRLENLIYEKKEFPRVPVLLRA